MRLHTRHKSGIDLFCQLERVRLGDQPFGHERVSRVAWPMSTIRECQLHGLGNDVHCFGTTALMNGLQVKVFDNVEDLCHMNSTGTRRRKANDTVVTIQGGDGCPINRFVVGKICFSNRPTILKHPLRNIFGKRTTIKPVRPFGGDTAIRLSKVRLYEQLSSQARCAVLFQ